MLQRMSVDSNDSNGSSPLMVLLVEMLVKAGMVEEPARKDEGELYNYFMADASSYAIVNLYVIRFVIHQS